MIDGSGRHGRSWDRRSCASRYAGPMTGPSPVDGPDDAHDSDDDALALAQAMLDAARQGHTDPLVALIDKGAPVDMRDGQGNTLLMLAAYHGHAELVTALAARGADVDRPNDRGQSPLAGAVFKAEPDVVRALVDAGADPDAGTPSARDAAVVFGRKEYLGMFPAQA
jgi:ankyrin repeat protein